MQAHRIRETPPSGRVEQGREGRDIIIVQYVPYALGVGIEGWMDGCGTGGGPGRRGADRGDCNLLHTKTAFFWTVVGGRSCVRSWVCDGVRLGVRLVCCTFLLFCVWVR